MDEVRMPIPELDEILNIKDNENNVVYKGILNKRVHVSYS